MISLCSLLLLRIIETRDVRKNLCQGLCAHVFYLYGVSRSAMLSRRRRVGEACGLCVSLSGALKCPALGRLVLRLVGLDYQLDTFSIRTGRQRNQIKTCLKGAAHKIVFLPLSLHIECLQVSRLSLRLFC
jgi:hypothetical protein